MSDLDKLKDKYDKKDDKASSNVKNAKALTKELETKKDSAPVRAVKQAVSGFRSQWSGIDDEGKVGIGKGTPGIYYNTVAIPAMAGLVDDKYAPDFAVEADKKAGRIREAVRKDMGIDAPKGALEHFAQAGGEMLAQLPVPGAWLNRVLSPVKSAGVAGKIAASPVEYLSPIVDPKKINYGVGTGFGGTIGTVGEMLEEPTSKALGGLIQKYETGGKVGQVKSFFSAIDKAIDTLKQKKGTGEQILKEIEKAPGVKKEELELRKIPQKLKDKKSITQEEVKALAAETPAPGIKAIVKSKEGVGLPEDWKPTLDSTNQAYLDVLVEPVVDPAGGRNLGFLVKESGEIVDYDTLFDMKPEEFGVGKATYNDMMIAAKKVKQQFDRALTQEDSARAPKFERYTTPGGENYREILLQVDRPSSARQALGGDPVEVSTEEAAKKIGISPEEFAEDSTVLLYPSGYYIEKLKSGRYISVVENRDKLSSNLSDVEDFLASGMESNLGVRSTSFQGGHFDEPNVVVHARVTDRTGPNGEKVLYVEEIQSDWHQAARKDRDSLINEQLEKERGAINRQANEIMKSIGRLEITDENVAMRDGMINKLTRARREEIAKEIPKDAGYQKALDQMPDLSAEDLLFAYSDRLTREQKDWLRDFERRWENDVDGTPAGQAMQDQLVDEYQGWLRNNSLKGVPDAPWKNTANELAVKQILDVAAKEGYDTVAFSPGSEHVKRYGMGQYFDELKATKLSNGKIELIGNKDGRKVVEKAVDPEDLADYIGKEKAENIMEQLKKSPPRNEAADELRGFISELQTKYDQELPTFLHNYVTPEERTRWNDLLEKSNQWDDANRTYDGKMPGTSARLAGPDLELTTAEGAGKKKIYDEIIPNYVRKYAKKEFGAEPGEIEISTGAKGKTYEQYLDEILEDPYRYIDEDEYYDVLHSRVSDRAAQQGIDVEDAKKWDELMARETNEADQIWADVENEFYEQKAKELAAKDTGEKLRAFAVPVTPQMREKITSQGQPLFSVAAPVGLGATQAVPEAEPSREPVTVQEPEEMPVPYQSGGRAKQDEEDRRGIIDEDPIVSIVRDAAKQHVQGKEVESGVFGVRKGPVTVGRQMVNMRDPGSNEYVNAQADFARLAEKYGRGNVAAQLMKPDQTKGVYMGDVTASYPVGEGRLIGGVRGMKTPEKTGVTGYNLGYSGKVGPGYLDAMVMKPTDKRQDTRYQVGYTIPFSSGGPVGFETGGKVGKTREAAEKLLRVLHGSPTSIVPSKERAIDVTTDQGYAVKRGTDKMLGKEGPPMVNKFDIPESRLLRFEEQYSPADVALMKRFFNKLPSDQPMTGEEIYDLAQGRDVVLDGIAKAGGFAGYERPNTGAVGKGQWFRITDPEDLKKARKHGGLI